MIYRVIGLMSGSSLDGLDIAFVHFQETGGRWTFELVNTSCYPYDDAWKEKLQTAPSLNALDYHLLHTSYGQWMGEQVNRFIADNNLFYQVQLICSHGHTAFHMPASRMTAQLGDGAALAATTGINVVSDLRAMDIALGGQGAPIVPIGEKWLFPDHDMFLNLGGIANMSHKGDEKSIGFDICPANRVLNILAGELGKEFDEDGILASGGQVDGALLEKLNELSYYKAPYPKSLANDFGTGVVYPLIKNAGCSPQDALRTYCEHIAIQVANAIALIPVRLHQTEKRTMFISGGGAKNIFLISRINEWLEKKGLAIFIPGENTINYKEALVMAFIGVLRWREENNVLASVTGATRNSIGGAVWIGQQA